MDSEGIRNRLKMIMHFKSMNTTQFSEAIQVQRSSLTHILNGRNNASLDVVTKVVDRYPEVDFKWLVMGIGSLTASESSTTLTEDTFVPNSVQEKVDLKETNSKLGSEHKKEDLRVEKVLFFYSDGTFVEYKSNS